MLGAGAAFGAGVQMIRNGLQDRPERFGFGIALMHGIAFSNPEMSLKSTFDSNAG
jgi:hypothetical protein